MPKTAQPQNIEAEQLTIGSILIEPSRLAAARKLLAPADFYTQRYRTVFEHICALADDGSAVDSITLSSRLNALPGSTDQRTFYDDLGGDLALMHLMDAAITPSNAGHYARLVKDCALKRTGMERAKELYFILRNDPEGLSKVQASNGHYHFSKVLEIDDDPIPVCVADVEQEHVEFWWKPWLMVGKFHVWSGDPGIFKSGVSLELAARVTTAKPMPFCHDPLQLAGNVLILAAEDGIGDTIKARFAAAGGDERKLFVFTPGDLPDLSNIERLRRIIRKLKIKLLILDPLASFVPDGIERRGKIALRQELLYPLVRMAEETRCAIIALAHLNKGSGTSSNALYRSSGYLDYVAVARATILLTKHPKDETKFLFVASKMNLAKAPQTLVYRIEQTESEVPFVEFEAVTDEWNSGNVLYEPVESPEKRQSQRDTKEWLLSFLADGDWHPAATMEREAKEDLGISQSTFQRARDDLRAGKQISKEKKRSAWYWCLTGTADVSPTGALPLAEVEQDARIQALLASMGDEPDPYAEDDE